MEAEEVDPLASLAQVHDPRLGRLGLKVSVDVGIPVNVATG